MSTRDLFAMPKKTHEHACMHVIDAICALFRSFVAFLFVHNDSMIRLVLDMEVGEKLHTRFLLLASAHTIELFIPGMQIIFTLFCILQREFGHDLISIYTWYHYQMTSSAYDTMVKSSLSFRVFI